MTVADQIAAVYAIGGCLFLGGFLLSVITTGARALWYLRNAGKPIPGSPTYGGQLEVIAIPRLLVRDVIVKTGLCISFGLIAALRFLPPDTRIAFTTGNLGWALITTVPAVIAIVTYNWFELRVISRARL